MADRSMPQRGGHLGQQVRRQRAVPQHRRCREGQPVRAAPHPHQARLAFLHDHAGWRGVPPAPSQAWQVPRVGCPAKGSSVAGVKIRTR